MTYRLIAILLLIFLQGCDSRVDSLQAENKKLKAEVSALAITNADRQLEIEYMASEASFAAGCDYLIAVCPGAAVETGRKALSSGYGGNGGWFWLAFILKLLAIGAVSGGCVGVALWLWYCAVKPAKSESDDAQKNIDQAGEKIAAAKQFVERVKKEAKAADAIIAAKKEEIIELEKKLNETQNRTEIELKRQESIKLATAALRGFT